MPSVQQHLPIKDIKEGIILLKDGGTLAVLACSSVNFALKSNEEQEALIMQFRNFLNSLDFSLQILIASRKYNLTPYLAALSQKQKEQTEELLQIQAQEYIDFIKTISANVNIVTESFYVVIPYYPSAIKKHGVFKKLFGAKETTEQDFYESKNQLLQRVEFIKSGIAQMGLKTIPLGQEELVELLYSMYNVSAQKGQSQT